MIAKNYIRYPEALRFQREMFSNGYHNSPRIMRLMEVVFEWTAAVPQWVKDARARAKALAKKVQQACVNWVADVELLQRCKRSGAVGQYARGKAQSMRFDHIRLPIKDWTADLQINLRFAH